MWPPAHHDYESRTVSRFLPVPISTSSAHRAARDHRVTLLPLTAARIPKATPESKRRGRRFAYLFLVSRRRAPVHRRILQLCGGGVLRSRNPIRRSGGSAWSLPPQIINRLHPPDPCCPNTRSSHARGEAKQSRETSWPVLKLSPASIAFYLHEGRRPTFWTVRLPCAAPPDSGRGTVYTPAES